MDPKEMQPTTAGTPDSNPVPSDRSDVAHTLYEINYERSGTSEYIYGYHPAQFKKGYFFNPRLRGHGQTIAIIGAFDYPTLFNDVEVFGRQFGLPPIDLELIYARGVKPPVDTGWAMETALDVEWAYALAPEARILCVLSASNTFIDLFQAVDVANAAGADIISMSWGGYEFSSETAYDVHMSKPGVVYVAGSGDIGGFTIYPSVSQKVVSVGGTRLFLDECGNRLGPETAWANGGGGPSIFVPIPPWQAEMKDVAAKCGAYRGTPDVALNCDATTGVAIYDTTPYNGISGWTTIGGTSFSAPAWAAIIALMRQSENNPYTNFSEVLYSAAGKTSYTLPQNYFTDITLGSAVVFHATPGWDFCTGLGSPVVGCLEA